jgi:dipeptidase E
MLETLLKLLLTSGGVKNATMLNALVAMLPKPLSECNALAITTGSYINANGADRAFRFFDGTAATPMPSWVGHSPATSLRRNYLA